jgi:hypothetical protein
MKANRVHDDAGKDRGDIEDAMSEERPRDILGGWGKIRVDRTGHRVVGSGARKKSVNRYT